MDRADESTGTSNHTVRIKGVQKSNLGPVGTGELELFPDDRPAGPMDHAFEAAQRFAAQLNHDG